MLLNELGTGFAQVLELRLKRVLSLLKSILLKVKTLLIKDPVQASEKLYKTVEEAVKAMAIALNIEKLTDVEKMGR